MNAALLLCVGAAAARSDAAVLHVNDRTPPEVLMLPTSARSQCEEVDERTGRCVTYTLRWMMRDLESGVAAVGWSIESDSQPVLTEVFSGTLSQHFSCTPGDHSYGNCRDWCLCEAPTRWDPTSALAKGLLQGHVYTVKVTVTNAVQRTAEASTELVADATPPSYDGAVWDGDGDEDAQSWNKTTLCASWSVSTDPEAAVVDTYIRWLEVNVSSGAERVVVGMTAVNSTGSRASVCVDESGMREGLSMQNGRTYVAEVWERSKTGFTVTRRSDGFVYSP